MTEAEKRARVLLYAYAYEIHNDSLVSDSEFDSLCKSIDTSVKSGNKVLDDFFSTYFTPYTGQWVRKFPMLDALEFIYQQERDNVYTSGTK